MDEAKAILPEKEYRRVNRALDYFEFRMEKLKAEGITENSTQGHEANLEEFANKYIYKTQSIDSELSPEDIAIKKEVEAIENIMKDAAFINAVDFGGIEKRAIFEAIQNAETEKNLEKINEIKLFMIQMKNLHSRPQMVVMSYMKYFLENIDNPSIDNAIKNEMAYLMMETYTQSLNVTHLYARIVNTYSQMKGKAELFSLDKNYPYHEEPVQKFGEIYVRYQITEFITMNSFYTEKLP